MRAKMLDNVQWAGMAGKQFSKCQKWPIYLLLFVFAPRNSDSRLCQQWNRWNWLEVHQKPA